MSNSNYSEVNAEYKKFAINIAKQAGEIILRDFSLNTKRDRKDDGTFITKTDIEINELVVNSIKENFSNHSILAEEGSSFSEDSEYVWLCDPLDGTNQFARSVALCSFSLSLTKNGESIIGVIYDPFVKRMFFAEKGKGAFMNDQKIQVSTKDTLSGSQLGIIQWNGAPFNFSDLPKIFREKYDTRSMQASIAYMGALVAGGAFEGTIFPGDQPTETSAIKILVEEAGGKVTDILGNDQRYDKPIKGHIASNNILHDQLISIVRDNVI